MTAKMLLEQYMAERHALGFVSKTDEGCIRRFLRDYKEPEDRGPPKRPSTVLQTGICYSPMETPLSSLRPQIATIPLFL